jgi:hypothetical protein
VASVIHINRSYGTSGRFYAALCSMGQTFFRIKAVK